MNTHLNIYRFFNGSDEHHLEDNLSRAFALCLKYDSVFLDQVLRFVLTDDEYERLFNTDFPDYNIKVDLQNRVDQFEGFARIVGVACSGIAISNFDNVQARDTGSPETDVCIQINDTCLLFEFKRTSEDCAAQLKCQAELAAKICGCPSPRYIDLSWGKIIKILLNVSSLQKQISAENPFTGDFIRFLEQFPADWFPTRRLQNVPFPSDENDPNTRFLNKRLNQLKFEVGNGQVTEYSGRYNRLAIKVDHGWINEINIDPVVWDNRNYVAIRMHFGDTKGQGQHFFRRRPYGIELSDKIVGHTISVVPYLKISDAYGSALFWICPTIEESKKTHTKEFFDKFAGKWDLSEWEDFGTELSDYLDEWKEKCLIADGTQKVSWDENLTQTGRTRFLVSVGTYLRIFVPYTLCQEQDDAPENGTLIRTFNEIIDDVVAKVEAAV